MSLLTVIVAPQGLEGVRSVLHDWSSVGMLDNFAWAQPGQEASRDVDCLHIRGGQQRGTTLRAVVADSGADQVQVCSLVPLFGAATPLSTSVEQGIVQLLAATGVPVVRARLVIPLPGGPPAPVPIALEGWNNFVLSPDERTGPRVAGIALSDDAPARLDVHIAQSTAGLLGLWAGVDTPSHEWRPMPGENARMISTYYRRLIGDEAESALRHAVMSMEHGLPRPHRHGISATYVPDPRAAAGAMAESWWTKHRSALHSHRDVIPQTAPQAVGIRDALRHFVSYMAAAIRNAPAAWLSRMQQTVYSTVARTVSDAVYGSGSAYTVVVKGLTGEGRPAGVADVRSSAAAVDAALQRAGFARAQEGHADNAAIWSDFVDGALTLADGSGRVAEMPPISVGADLGVVKDPAWIAPPATAAFQGVNAQLEAVIKAGEVHSYDPLATAHLERELDQHGQTLGLQFEVSSARAHLQQWKNSTPASYADEVAGWVMRAYDATRTEINDAISLLQEASGTDQIVVDEQQRTLSKRIRRIVFGTLLAAAAAVACIVIGALTVVIGAVIGAAIVLVGILSMFITFFKGQRRLFQLLNRRQALDDAAQIAAKNLQAALRDLGRITGVYAQLQVWVPVLARFLAEPFGHSQHAEPTDLRLAGPFTRNIAIGVIQRNADAEQRAAAEIRRDIFTVGWLADPWQRLLDTAEKRLTADDAHQLTGANAMYRQPAVNSDGTPSVLTRWGETVVRDGTLDERAADHQWAEVVASLHLDRAEMSKSLTRQVWIAGTRTGVSREAFLGTLDQQSAEADGWLDSALLSDHAATHNESRIVKRTAHRETRGLSENLSIVDYTIDIPAYQFRHDPRTTQDVPHSEHGPSDEFVIPQMPSFTAHQHGNDRPSSTSPGGASPS